MVKGERKVSFLRGPWRSNVPPLCAYRQRLAATRTTDCEGQSFREIGTCLPLDRMRGRYARLFPIFYKKRRLKFGRWRRKTSGPLGCGRRILPICSQKFVRSISELPSSYALIVRLTRTTAGQQFARYTRSSLARREEILLREWFQMNDVSGTDKARLLVARILETGLEPFNQPKTIPRLKSATSDWLLDGRNVG